MNRTHIHFASKPGAISGFRKSSEVLVHVDMKKAMEDGLEFFMSENNVILCVGPIDKKYFLKVE
jgi:2'-phosphotransferase